MKKMIFFIAVSFAGLFCYSQAGLPIKEKVNFTRRYIRQHDGKTIVEVPEVYELFNIVLALTDISSKYAWLVKTGTGYFQKVQDRFGVYKQEPAVLALDSILKKNTGFYTKLKMESYCFEFNRKGKIVHSKIFDRMWGQTNDLIPLIGPLQYFSDHSQFRKFYEINKPFYEEQISFYRDSANIPEMIKWLRKNFPSSDYHCFKIIFSPLVNGNQSAQGFSSHGFKEAQAHVNFPYNSIQNSTTSSLLVAGNIVFTELNHTFINPESEKKEYAGDVNLVCRDLSHWMEEKASKGYGNSYSCFNEYMNWVLVSLRYAEYAPRPVLNDLLRQNEEYMQKTRGFKKFPEFSRFLVEIYSKRKPGQTVADLYPQIIEWFKQNQ